MDQASSSHGHINLVNVPTGQVRQWPSPNFYSRATLANDIEALARVLVSLTSKEAAPLPNDIEALARVLVFLTSKEAAPLAANPNATPPHGVEALAEEVMAAFTSNGSVAPAPTISNIVNEPLSLISYIIACYLKYVPTYCVEGLPQVEAAMANGEALLAAMNPNAINPAAVGTQAFAQNTAAKDVEALIARVLALTIIHMTTSTAILECRRLPLSMPKLIFNFVLTVFQVSMGAYWQVLTQRSSSSEGTTLSAIIKSLLLCIGFSSIVYILAETRLLPMPHSNNDHNLGRDTSETNKTPKLKCIALAILVCALPIALILESVVSAWS